MTSNKSVHGGRLKMVGIGESQAERELHAQ